MSKINGKGRRLLFLFITFGTILVVIFTSFHYMFFPSVYVHQTDIVPNGCISSTQAYEIAIPYIREYASENGRLIMQIHISFWNSSRDLAGQRGNSSLWYPVWQVYAGFLTNPFDPWPIFGYSVLIWADTGEIQDKSAQGVM